MTIDKLNSLREQFGPEIKQLVPFSLSQTRQDEGWSDEEIVTLDSLDLLHLCLCLQRELNEVKTRLSRQEFLHP